MCAAFGRRRALPLVLARLLKKSSIIFDSSYAVDLLNHLELLNSRAQILTSQIYLLDFVVAFNYFLLRVLFLWRVVFDQAIRFWDLVFLAAATWFILSLVCHLIMNSLTPAKRFAKRSNYLPKKWLGAVRPTFDRHIRPAESVNRAMMDQFYSRGSSETPYNAHQRKPCCCGAKYRRRHECVEQTSGHHA